MQGDLPFNEGQSAPVPRNVCEVCRMWGEVAPRCHFCGFRISLRSPPAHISALYTLLGDFETGFDKLDSVESEMASCFSLLQATDPASFEPLQKLEGQKNQYIATLYKLMHRYFVLIQSAVDYFSRPNAVKKADSLYGQFVNSVVSAELKFYQFIHPELLSFKEEWLAKDLRALVYGERDKEAVNSIITKEASVGCSAEVLDVTYCRLLVDEMKNLKKLIPLAPLDYMGLYLEALHFTPFMKELTNVIAPLAKQFYSHMDLTYSHSSIVHYEAGVGVQSEAIHIDNSDLTMNLCLGDVFEGGDLQLHIPEKRPQMEYVPSCLPDEAPAETDATCKLVLNEFTSIQTWKHKVGRALFHPGELVHASDKILSGERWNLIVWWKASYKFHKFLALPPEIQEYILSFTSPQDLSSLSCCSKQMHTLARSNSLWKRLYESIIDKPVGDAKEEDTPWWKLFKENTCQIKRLKEDYDTKAAEPPQWMPVKRLDDSYYTSQGLKPPSDYAERNLPNTAQFVPILVRQQKMRNSARCYIQ